MAESYWATQEDGFAGGIHSRKLPPDWPLVEEWLLTLQAAGRSMGTIAVYRRHLAAWADWLVGRGRALAQARPEDVRLYLAERLRGFWRPATARAAHSYLSAFYCWLVAEGEIAAPPTRGVPRPRPPETIVRALSPDEVRRLLAACTRDRLGLRDQAIVLVLYDTGLRAAELLSLQVDPAGRYEQVVVMGKGGRERTVRLGDVARRAVMRYARAWRLASGALWRERHGRPLGYSGLHHIISSLGERAGLGRVTPHMLRHSFAQALLRETGDWDAVRVLGGWRTSDVMLRYLRGREMERALEVHRRFSPADRLGGHA